MREVGRVGPDTRLSGAQLATHLLGPKSPSRIQLSPHAALGVLSSGEAEAFLVASILLVLGKAEPQSGGR
jgi:hypothetical protein